MQRQLVRSLLRVDRKGQILVRELRGHTLQRDISMPAVNRQSNSENLSSGSFGTAAISVCLRDRHRMLLHWVNLGEANTQLKNL